MLSRGAGNCANSHDAPVLADEPKAPTPTAPPATSYTGGRGGSGGRERSGVWL